MIEPLKRDPNKDAVKVLADKVDEIIEAVNLLLKKSDDYVSLYGATFVEPEEPKECEHKWAEVDGTNKEHYKWCMKCHKRVDLEPKPEPKEKLADVIFKAIGTWDGESPIQKFQAAAALDFIKERLPKRRYIAPETPEGCYEENIEFNRCLTEIKEIIARMR